MLAAVGGSCESTQLRESQTPHALSFVWNVHTELLFRSQTRHNSFNSIGNGKINTVFLHVKCLLREEFVSIIARAKCRDTFHEILPFRIWLEVSSKRHWEVQT